MNIALPLDIDLRGEKTQRGTSLALSRFLFRFAIPAQILPTDSDRIIATIKNIAMQKCRNADLRTSIYEQLRQSKTKQRTFIRNSASENQRTCRKTEIRKCRNAELGAQSRTSAKIKNKAAILRKSTNICEN